MRLTCLSIRNILNIPPNTTNKIEGQFSHLKRLLGNHRGLHLEQKKKLIEAILSV